jgi:hypothetical protein
MGVDGEERCMTTVPRRHFLLAVSGGLTAAAFAWSCGDAAPREPARAAPAAPAGVSGYLDHDGWMLTRDDREKIGAVSFDSGDTPSP